MGKKNNSKIVELRRPRNPFAASSWNRSGSGRHPDKKKKNNKLACRRKVQVS
jgi:hypothetical protein